MKTAIKIHNQTYTHMGEYVLLLTIDLEECQQKNVKALAKWLSWLGHWPLHQKVAGLIPAQGMNRRQLTDVSLSH